MNGCTRFILAGSSLLASAAMAEPAGAPLTAPSVAFSFVRVIGALALVFAVFLGGVWLFRNWQRLTIQRGRTPKLNVLETRSLGPRHALYVIGYEQQRFLISCAPSGMTMLATLPPSSAAEPEPQPLPAPSFADALARMLGPKAGRLP